MKDFVSFFLVLILITTFYTYLESKSLGVDYVVSNVDGKKYLVRNYEDKQEAADLLSRMTIRLRYLVDNLGNALNEEDTKRLRSNFNEDAISESSPGSTYTSYSINKGSKLVFCIRDRKKGQPEKLIDLNTIMFVAIHELSHLATKSIGHTPEFWDNMKKLLKRASELKMDNQVIYKPVEYSKQPKDYCGMQITSSPLY
jgi:hypothetical protein